MSWFMRHNYICYNVLRSLPLKTQNKEEPDSPQWQGTPSLTRCRFWLLFASGQIKREIVVRRAHGSFYVLLYVRFVFVLCFKQAIISGRRESSCTVGGASGSKQTVAANQNAGICWHYGERQDVYLTHFNYSLIIVLLTHLLGKYDYIIKNAKCYVIWSESCQGFCCHLEV